MQLHHMVTPPNDRKDEQRKFLTKLRYEAKKRGLRVLKDWSGTWSLVDTKVEPQRALQGLLHVDLLQIAIASRHRCRSHGRAAATFRPRTTPCRR